MENSLVAETCGVPWETNRKVLPLTFEIWQSLAIALDSFYCPHWKHNSNI